ncbi:uncharacterized protein LOC111870630 isoform X2 [Cryptotermes secundus]|uniref:uncharacterized protein LOC111870630 isoform X2 n=1 Tax=Cryptotermes secundus TaxID=105785 RepID=UPI001454E02D|nr:uncharacterized protein LOC111870630 isoform X2 [Cryptotermes secundus]
MLLEELIEEVRKYPCLWNKGLEEYRNQNMRDNAWDTISGELNTPVEDLKVDWKKLQDSHRQAMLRRKTKSGQGARKMKPWKYEALMSFLLSDLTPRQTESNIDVVEETEEREDGVGLMLDEEEEEQTESAYQNRRESGSKNSRKFGKRFDKERNFDKVISFMQEKERDRKQPGPIDHCDRGARAKKAHPLCIHSVTVLVCE